MFTFVCQDSADLACQSRADVESSQAAPTFPNPKEPWLRSRSKIREQLRQWEIANADQNLLLEELESPLDYRAAISNSSSSSRTSRLADTSEEDSMLGIENGGDGFPEVQRDRSFLIPGDLVDLPYEPQSLGLDFS